jgi:hypothetical protein
MGFTYPTKLHQTISQPFSTKNLYYFIFLFPKFYILQMGTTSARQPVQLNPNYGYIPTVSTQLVSRNICQPWNYDKSMSSKFLKAEFSG